MPAVEHVLKLLALGSVATVFGGYALARGLRSRGLRWTWASLGFPVGLLLAGGTNPLVFWPIFWACALACAIGAHWHHTDLSLGADYAEAANNLLGIVAALRRWSERQAIKRDGWVKDGRLVVGVDAQRLAVSIPVGYSSGRTR